MKRNARDKSSRLMHSHRLQAACHRLPATSLKISAEITKDAEQGAKREVVVQASPRTPLEVIHAQFLFELLVVLREGPTLMLSLTSSSIGVWIGRLER